MAMPKYVALCTDDEDVLSYFGGGDTPDEAYEEFMQNGEFEQECEYWGARAGDPRDVYIYTTVCVEDSDWEEEERHPEWVWCLDKKIETRIATVPEIQ